MYEIRHAGAKGLGVFATKWIAPGTRILAERPVFTVKSERDVYLATRKLSPEDRHHLLHLSVSGNKRSPLLDWLEAAWYVSRGTLTAGAQRKANDNAPRLGLSTVSEYIALLGAFRNNNFDIGNSVQAVFRDICRLNHSCVPNTQGNFNSNLGCFTIHALRPIEEKEQILVSYLELHGAVRDVRRALLRRSYGFDCECPTCDLSTQRGRDGEKKRVALRDRLARYAQQASQRQGTDYASELQMLLEVIRLFGQEGLAGRELGTM